MFANPLVSDRHVEFLLREVLDLPGLLTLPAFADHSVETCELFLGSARRLAREVLYPAYRPMDQEAPHLADGRVAVHPRMKLIYPKLVELGVGTATRPHAVGGQQLPVLVGALASAYLMAGNLAAFGYVGLTAGAAQLIESFGDEQLKEQFMRRMHAGEWAGTMALTEPQAGSSLADLKTRATPAADGTHRIQGSKVFISGGDQDLTENIVHLTLARIDGAPEGIKGISLFAVPRLRPHGSGLIPNDVQTTGVFHKIGWRGLPSVALTFGERDDCWGWLVGQPHQGLRAMFQMMNEARVMVGANGVATASVAYHEALEYAKTRPQGRPYGADPRSPQVPIIEHADVRRMLLRQKAIVEVGLCLVATSARYADVAEHGATAEEKKKAKLLLDLLTPVAKTFPAERGFEANALSVQIHGGYGYTSEYLPESWLRDQKLNSIHEGTTTIQGLDLLGRKVVAESGAAVRALGEEITATVARAKAAGLPEEHGTRLLRAFESVAALTLELALRGASGDVDGMLLHSADYLELFSVLVTSWLWLLQGAAAAEALRTKDDPFHRGIARAAEYWLETELCRIPALVELAKNGESPYRRMDPSWF